jgi:hypothetical protein
MKAAANSAVAVNAVATLCFNLVAGCCVEVMLCPIFEGYLKNPQSGVERVDKRINIDELQMAQRETWEQSSAPYRRRVLYGLRYMRAR